VKTRKKTETEKSRKAVRISVKSVRVDIRPGSSEQEAYCYAPAPGHACHDDDDDDAVSAICTARLTYRVAIDNRVGADGIRQKFVVDQPVPDNADDVDE